MGAPPALAAACSRATTTALDTISVVGGGGRAGWYWRWTDRLGLWPRLGLDIYQRKERGRTKEDSSDLGGSLRVPVVWQPFEHALVSVGLRARAPIDARPVVFSLAYELAIYW